MFMYSWALLLSAFVLVGVLTCHRRLKVAAAARPVYLKCLALELFGLALGVAFLAMMVSHHLPVTDATLALFFFGLVPVTIGLQVYQRKILAKSKAVNIGGQAPSLEALADREPMPSPSVPRFSQHNWRRISEHELEIPRPTDAEVAAVFLAALVAFCAAYFSWPLLDFFRDPEPFLYGAERRHLPDLVFIFVIAGLTWWAVVALLRLALPYVLSLDFKERTYRIIDGAGPFRRITSGTFADIDHLFIRLSYSKVRGQWLYAMMLKWQKGLNRPPHPLGGSYSQEQAERDASALAEAMGTIYVGRISPRSL